MGLAGLRDRECSLQDTQNPVARRLRLPVAACVGHAAITAR